MQLVKSVGVCSLFHIIFLYSAAQSEERMTSFGNDVLIQKMRIESIFHPILHGCAEKQDSLLKNMVETIKATGSALKELNLTYAYNTISRDPNLWATLKVAGSSALRGIFGKYTERALFYTNFFDANPMIPQSSAGRASLEAIREAEAGVNKEFPDWKADKCPQGMCNCENLGNNSKAILSALYTFFDNIHEYEQCTKQQYFTDEHRLRIFTFVAHTITRICETNLLHAIVNKGSSAPNDEQLKNYVKVMNYLRAIPTQVQDIEEHWRMNSREIDELLSFLPIKQQRDLYDWMRTMMHRSQNPCYGHQDGDCGINLLLSGNSGTGKTFVGTKLPKLLGFTPIIITLEELRRGQDRNFNNLENLVEGAELSGIETQLLRFDASTKKSLVPLNPICFIDEVDEDRHYSISELKERFDQFKRISLPSLGIEIPGFSNCIFTTNNKTVFKDPGLISRFIQIQFPDMLPEKKIAILLRVAAQKLLVGHSHLIPKENYIAQLIQDAVQFDDNINIRILIDNLDSIINFVQLEESVKQGEGWLVPLEDRTGPLETYQQFLERKFGNLNLGQSKLELEVDSN